MLVLSNQESLIEAWMETKELGWWSIMEDHLLFLGNLGVTRIVGIDSKTLFFDVKSSPEQMLDGLRGVIQITEEGIKIYSGRPNHDH